MTERRREELERQRARWWATVSSGDLDGYLSLFAPDAVWVTPELDEIVGRDAIRAWLGPVFAQFDYELTITVADVRVAGDLGIERARFVSRMTPKPPTLRPVPSPEGAIPSSSPSSSPAVGDRDDAPTPVPGDGADEPGVTPAVGPDDAGAPDRPEIAGSEAAAGRAADGGDAPAARPDDGPAVAGPADDSPAEDSPVDDSPVDETTPEGPDRDHSPDDDAGEAGLDVDDVEAPLEAAAPGAGDHEPHEGRYLMYWRWSDDAGWLVHRYADVTGVG